MFPLPLRPRAETALSCLWEDWGAVVSLFVTTLLADSRLKEEKRGGILDVFLSLGRETPLCT